MKGKRISAWLAAAIAAGALQSVGGQPATAPQPPRERPAAGEPIVVFNLMPLYALNLRNPADRRQFWDLTHLVVALQGLANRDAPRLYIRYIPQADDFWWRQMREPGAWLAGRRYEEVRSPRELVRRFRKFVRGLVLWDERVPATSNLASAIAGADSLLPVRYDTNRVSLCQTILSDAGLGLPVKVRLLREDGRPLFTGQGRVPGTELPSTGSAKCDAYLWLIEHYIKPGKTNPHLLGYYLDAFWLKAWRAAGPENHTLSNHDYIIANRGAVFDLGVWDDEAPIDDPDQAPGTDFRTLKRLLRACYDRFGGQGVIHVAGFVPWAYKYTRHHNSRWSAGGKHGEVDTEWRYAAILSCYNAYMDADALGLGAMANASFFQHYPLKPVYPQPPRPARGALIRRGLLRPDGSVPPLAFVAHYVGDYDSAAWLYRKLPEMWRDPARGKTPLSWAFNPNLAERFPLGMAWARERATTNDWFVAGDSGAGYLNPGYLTPPRPYSGLPSGLAPWEAHCRRWYRQWDISLTGFVIDGFAPGMNEAVLDAYARFSPDGVAAQKIPAEGLHGGMPFLRMGPDVGGSPASAAKRILRECQGPKPRFVVCRSILKPPSWYLDVQREIEKAAGASVRVVDLYTLMRLVRIRHEQERDQGAAQSAARATQSP